jgi:hypothetical protein
MIRSAIGPHSILMPRDKDRKRVGVAVDVRTQQGCIVESRMVEGRMVEGICPQTRPRSSQHLDLVNAAAVARPLLRQ